MKYVMGNFETRGMGLSLDFNQIIQGNFSSVFSAASDLAYKEAMKLVEKEANIVHSFAKKAIAAANAVNAQIQAIQSATTKAQADAAISEMNKQASLAAAEASNAAKNYTVTQAALKTFLTIKGLPSYLVEAANKILAAAKKSLDSAANAAAAARQNADAASSAYNGKNFGEDFNPNIQAIGGSGMNPYIKYAIIGGGVLIGAIALAILIKSMRKPAALPAAK